MDDSDVRVLGAKLDHLSQRLDEGFERTGSQLIEIRSAYSDQETRVRELELAAQACRSFGESLRNDVLGQRADASRAATEISACAARIVALEVRAATESTKLRWLLGMLTFFASIAGSVVTSWMK